jgi:hypothetical protein
MLATRLRRWFVEHGARLARSVLGNSATSIGHLDQMILLCYLRLYMRNSFKM